MIIARETIKLTREDGKVVVIFAGAIAMVEPPDRGEIPKARSKVMISGNYRWFIETTDEVLAKLGIT